MRIRITLSAEKSGIIDFNYQHQIQAVIYGFLYRSNPDYAQWLHHQGFVYKKDKRFKLFEGEPVKFNFQPERPERFEPLKPKVVKSFKIFKNGKITGEIKGTLQPFTVTGPNELIRIGLECGYVEVNRDGQNSMV